MDWAEFVTLDLAQFDAPGGRQKLANQLRDAVHDVGFFYIINFGLTQDEVDQQFAIGKELFKLPIEEKMKHQADVEHGSYNGYRPEGTREQFPGLRDNVEMYNLFKLNGKLERSQPDIIQKHRSLIQKFQRHIVDDITKKLLVLIAIVMELPEDHLINGHKYDDISDCHLRYMLYHARTPEQNAKYGNVYAGGHTDFGTISLLFRQPIAGLQIRMSDGTWKWVKPRPESITVNVADALQFWSNGYLKSSVHRVVTPPDDQAHLDRLGLLYFVRPAYDLELKTLDSPLLTRLGLKGEKDEAAGIKAGDWVKARVREDVHKAVEGGHKEKTVLGGVKVRYYQS